MIVDKFGSIWSSSTQLRGLLYKLTDDRRQTQRNEIGKSHTGPVGEC